MWYRKALHTGHPSNACNGLTGGVETGDFSQCDTFRKGCSFSLIILGMTPVLQVSLKVFLYFAQRRAGQFKCSSILFTDHFKQNIVVSACHFSDATRV